MTASQSLPFTALALHFLPAPLSSTLSWLVEEQKENGVSTTADETCEAIEAWFKTVGGLLLAEYLDSSAPDSSLNRYVFAALESRRPMFVGQWVALGRGCLASLQEHWKKEHKPAWPGLKKLEFGTPGDPEHPVSRLVEYRNSFSHGSLAQVKDRILEHGWLLEDQVNLLAHDLIKRPIKFPLPDGSLAVLQGSEPNQTSHVNADSRGPLNISAYTPYVEVDDGSIRILGPGLAVKQVEEHWELALGSLGGTLDEEFLQRFHVALERYRREQNGHVYFETGLVPAAPDKRPSGVKGLDQALSEGCPLILVEYRPGTGLHRLASQLLGALDEACSTASVWRVLANHPGGSPSVFGRALLRHAEKVLGKAEGDLDRDGLPLLDAIGMAAAQLGDADRTVGVVVMDAASDAGSFEGEAFTIMDAFKAVSVKGSGYRLLLLAHPTNDARLPHDGELLVATPPSEPDIDASELETALEDWKTVNGELSVPILEWVLGGHGSKPRLWSEIVTEIEGEAGASAFSPAVEYALWTLAPFTDRTQCDDEALGWAPAGEVDGDYAKALRRASAR